MKKVGIFAGTFDPIHNGHIAVARLSLKDCLLDKVYFAVEERPWGAKTPIPVEKRQAMVDLSISGDKDIEQLLLPDKHFNVSKTLPYLVGLFAGCELFFMFGADVFMNMNSKTWPDLPKLLKHHLIIFERGDITEVDINQHAKTMGIHVAILTSESLGVSSTVVRGSLVAQSSDTPATVKEFIKSNNLYIN